MTINAPLFARSNNRNHSAAEGGLFSLASSYGWFGLIESIFCLLAPLGLARNHLSMKTPHRFVIMLEREISQSVSRQKFQSIDRSDVIIITMASQALLLALVLLT
jgi:hypothetical protein